MKTFLIRTSIIYNVRMPYFKVNTYIEIKEERAKNRIKNRSSSEDQGTNWATWLNNDGGGSSLLETGNKFEHYRKSTCAF